ncbi:MAG: hypothetical protein ACD_26C00118G0001, partial [uncultured bacterium]
METLILKNYGIKITNKEILQNTLNTIYKIYSSENTNYILRVIPKSPYKTVQSFINEYLVLEKLNTNGYNSKYIPIVKYDNNDNEDLYEKYVTEYKDSYISLFKYIENTIPIYDGEKINLTEIVRSICKLHYLLNELKSYIKNTDLYSKKYLKALFSNTNDYFNFTEYYKNFKSVTDSIGINKLMILDNYVYKLKDKFKGVKINDFSEQPIHGDLRPENVLFNTDCSVNSIIDFE